MSDIKAKLDEATAQLTGDTAPWALQDTTINGIDYRVYKHAPKTVKELLDAGRQHGEKTFIIYQDEQISFNEFFRRSDAIARQLVDKFNVNKGDRVAIAMRNYPEWMIAFTAICSLGAVAVPLNSWGQTAELEYGLSDASAKVVFLDQRRLDYISDRLAGLNIQAIVARAEITNLPEHCSHWQTELELAGNCNLPEVELKAEDPALIMYTSGTTGNPKGALSSNRALCQAIFNFEFAAIAAAMTNGEAIGKMLEKGYEPKVLLAVPLFHVSGCHTVFLLSLRAGRPIVMMYKWDVETALKLIESERITMISAVPTMLSVLLESPLWQQYDTSSLFSCGAGGAAQPPRLPGLIDAKMADSFPGTGYGLTETNASGFSSTGANYRHKALSAGTITPIVDVKIVADNGEALPPGEHGQIYLRTPTAVNEYLHKPDATAETFIDGWVATGDIGYLDEEGFLFLTDRAKDMIIRAGENIYSAEIEATALKMEGLLEAAAFGIPHDVLGEELGLAVCAKPDSGIDEQRVKDFFTRELAAFKVPSRVFIQQHELPKNATRKLLKKQIRENCLKKITDQAQFTHR